jgi:hydrophobe/amphiphile efflux-3 (HAE3) family protein
MVLRIVQFLVRRPWTTLAFIAMSVGLAGYAARTIRVRFQYRDFYDYPGNPNVPLLDRYYAEFGDPAGYVVLLIEASDVFQPPVLRYVSDLTRALEHEPQFADVTSLSNARSVRAQGDDVASGPVMGHLPRTAEEVEQLRSVALHGALLAKRVVSLDGTATAVLAKMRMLPRSRTVEQQGDAVAAASRILATLAPPPGVRVRVTGAPLVEVETTTALVRSQNTLTPVVLLVMILALVLTFRSVQGVLLPLAAVLVSVVWTAGIYSFFGRPLDMIGSVFPTILLVYGIVDPIFVYTRYLRKLDLGRHRQAAILEALSELVLPCFLTSLTTALGFAAFSTARLPMIRNFGVIVAIGVSLSFVTTLTVLPVLLALVPPPRRRRAATRASDWLDRALTRLWRTIRSRRSWVLGAALTIIGVGAFAASRLQIVNLYVGVLPRGPAQDSVHALERKLSGVMRVAVFLEGPPGSMKQPAVLKAIDAVDKLAEGQSIVNSSTSLADLVSDANEAFAGGDPGEHRVPDSPSLIAQYLAIIDPSDRADFVNGDYSESHIRMLLTDEGSLAIRRFRDRIQAEASDRLTPLGVTARVTGSVVGNEESDRIVVEVLWGFVAAFAIVVLMEWAVFRSLRVALVSIVPNLVPVAGCFIAMRLVGLDLRVDNALVLCVSVGGLFNTTIHIIARALQEVRAGATDPDEIMERALRAVGPASLYTAVILSLGFAVMGCSPFPGLQSLGLLSAITFMTGFVSDSTVTSTSMRSAFNWKRAIAAAGRATEVRADSRVEPVEAH